MNLHLDWWFPLFVCTRCATQKGTRKAESNDKNSLQPILAVRWQLSKLIFPAVPSAVCKSLRHTPQAVPFPN